MCTSYVPEHPTIVAVNFVHCPQIVSHLLQVRIAATSHMQTGEKRLGNDTNAIFGYIQCTYLQTIHKHAYGHTYRQLSSHSDHVFHFTCDLDIQD